MCALNLTVVLHQAPPKEDEEDIQRAEFEAVIVVVHYKVVRPPGVYFVAHADPMQSEPITY